MASDKRSPIPSPQPGRLRSLVRENLQLTIWALLIGGFVHTFAVEIYAIPTGSMTPTLLGAQMPGSSVGHLDANGDGASDLVQRQAARAVGRETETYNVYLCDGARYYYAGVRTPDASDAQEWRAQCGSCQDRIVVAKFLYWFAPPKRGDIIVFKPPEAIVRPGETTYVKRAAGLPGETLTFRAAPGVPGHADTMGRLVADGRPVDTPSFFARQIYEYRAGPGNAFLAYTDSGMLPRPEYIRYENRWLTGRPVVEIADIHVPNDAVFALGDNTVGSADSRFWGAVPLDRLRGRAIFRCNLRYFPYFSDPGFLN